MTWHVPDDDDACSQVRGVRGAPILYLTFAEKTSHSIPSRRLVLRSVNAPTNLRGESTLKTAK